MSLALANKSMRAKNNSNRIVEGSKSIS